VTSTVHNNRKPNGLKFDPTINFGQVLTIVGFIGTGFATYSQIDKRILVLEEATKHQIVVDVRQDSEMRENKIIVRDDLKDINKKLDRIIESR
jgi:hypothetical protein